MNPWKPTYADTALTDAAGSEFPTAKALNRAEIRIAAALFLGVPGTFLSPFALWLAIASYGQMTNGTFLAIPTLLVCIFSLVGLACLWWYVAFGLQSGIYGKLQITGVLTGICIFLLVIAIQFGLLRFA